MDETQVVQEEEYSFPYHYVSGTRGGFHQCFNFWWGINYEATIEFLIGKLENESFESLVDIGCGDGRLIKEVSGAFPGKLVCGVDYSKRAVDLARAMNPSGDYRVCDITKTNFVELYDVAMLIEVLEHIHPDFATKFMAGVCEILLPGGTLFLTVPHVNEPLTRKHYRHFTLDSLMKLMVGFKVEEVVFLEVSSNMKKRIDRLLTNKYFILNHKKALSIIYKFYKKNLFMADDEKQCRRIFVKLKKIRNI